MLDFKEEIAKKIVNQMKKYDLNEKELVQYIEIPKEKGNGDYAFPCFSLAKVLKKSPIAIAEEIKNELEKTEDLGNIEKIECVGGYLNFSISKKILANTVLANVLDENISIGKGKNIVIDYSAPNIAKPFHIGHLRSTVIGASLYNIYKYLGYNVTGINHLGDYGTQFGKLIEGYKLWGSEYDIDNNPIDELTKIYIRINDLCKENEEILENCRNNFKLLEEKDPYSLEVWEKFRNLSLQEFKRVYELLGTCFDSWNGESFYSDKMGEVISTLENTGKLISSEGAKIIELEESGINTPCIIKKSNGSTTYATRDLAAIKYRAKKYNFDKALYVVSYEQTLHFKQVYETAKLLGLDEKYTNGLLHVAFGMVSLPNGKMSTRGGNIIKLEDLLNEAIARAERIIEEKNPDLENKKEIAKHIGIGAVIFNDLSNSRIKDEIFDWDTILNFQGETGPYIQYTYVRTKSVLSKSKSDLDISNVNVEHLLDEYSVNVLKLIYNFENTLEMVTKKEEPSILSRYLIDLSKAYSNFYNENKIIVEDKNIENARVYLTYVTGEILKKGANLLGITMPEKM